jgi:acetolactate synthase-1/3 small subunit
MEEQLTPNTQLPIFTVTIYSENNVGLLNQIAIIFTRRNVNIWSMAVSASAIEGVHKFTVACHCDEETIAKVVRQIEKRIDVLKAFYFRDEEIVYQELALYKVPTDALLGDANFEQLVRKYNARILEINSTYAVIEKTGHCDETVELFNDLNSYGVLQFVRSGRVAVTKSLVERVSNFLEEQEIRRLHDERRKGAGDRIPEDAHTSAD